MDLWIDGAIDTYPISMLFPAIADEHDMGTLFPVLAAETELPQAVRNDVDRNAAQEPDLIKTKLSRCLERLREIVRRTEREPSQIEDNGQACLVCE